MRRYAQIIGDKVHALFEVDGPVMFDPSITMVDVTGTECVPGQVAVLRAGLWEFSDAEVVPVGQTIVPSLITPRQGKLALHQRGLLQVVEAAINEDAVAKIEWENAQDFKRDWPLLNSTAATLGLSPDQVDELFVLAATL